MAELFQIGKICQEILIRNTVKNNVKSYASILKDELDPSVISLKKYSDLIDENKYSVELLETI